MCVVTEKGYELESGRVIPHTGIDLALLNPEEFKELKETNVSMISMMQIKSEVSQIHTTLDELVGKLTEAIEASSKAQSKLTLDHSHCPVDDDAIVSIVETWYQGLLEKYRDPDHELSKAFTARTIQDTKQFFKDIIFTTGNLSKAIGAIVGLLSGFGFVVYLAIRLAVN